MRKDYNYNILAVDKNGIVIEILYMSDHLPSYLKTMSLRCKIKCTYCDEIILTKNYILAGNFKIGDRI